jgi:hypothetical protein
MPPGCAGALPEKEGRIQVLADLAPSSQTVGSSLRSHWEAKLKNKYLSIAPILLIFIYLQTYFFVGQSTV